MQIFIVSSYQVGCEHSIDHCCTTLDGATQYVKKEFGAKVFSTHDKRAVGRGFNEECRYDNGIDYVVIISSKQLM